MKFAFELLAILCLAQFLNGLEVVDTKPSTVSSHSIIKRNHRLMSEHPEILIERPEIVVLRPESFVEKPRMFVNRPLLINERERHHERSGIHEHEIVKRVPLVVEPRIAEVVRPGIVEPRIAEVVRPRIVEPRIAEVVRPVIVKHERVIVKRNSSMETVKLAENVIQPEINTVDHTHTNSKRMVIVEPRRRLFAPVVERVVPMRRIIAPAIIEPIVAAPMVVAARPRVFVEPIVRRPLII